ncbi:bifunctional nuclease family protein [Dactylosporangium roseum]|uniref:Bifunctional nuclease family protein n=1 Tax=Dactylosporangium roseum TaxID=47989 RepID=A0ABY5ZEK7_9ACTN|nr:FHA domain-containing protein [Dactylosporangium roseum]UWZ38744.1 bifunctional nuclease family protein [Dactylosporangium roseum]
MQQLVVVGVRAQTWQSRPMVLLKESSSGRHLQFPVDGGPRDMDEPISAELFQRALTALRAPLRAIEVVSAGAPFQLVLGEGIRVPAAPLEAIALARHWGVPIVTSEELLASAAIAAPEGPTQPLDLTAHMEKLPTGRATLKIRKGAEAGAEFALDGDVVRCGRDSANQIVLDDNTVSRKHVEFHRNSGGFGYSTLDLGSLNGTYVNGERVKSATLNDGDEVQVGKFTLQYQLR